MMNFGWERQSYRNAIVDKISTAADTVSQTSTVSLVASAPNSPGPAAKESGGQARLRLAVIVTAIVVTSAVALSPFFISLALHVSNNRTHDKEMDVRLEEIMTKNVSYCPYPLDHTSKGGCSLPCSALNWFQDPTIRMIKPTLNYVLILINLIAGIAFTFVWIALKKSHFKFPQVFVWYLFLSSTANGAAELFAVIAGDENTICSSNYLLDSVKNPATGCRVLGTLNHYLQIARVLLLTCSSANIWWVICFPTRARYFFEKTARIHAIQFSFCWILPGILIAITYAAGGTYRPVPSSRFCLPMPIPVMLVTFVLPMSLSTITIIIMLVHVINTLYNHHQFQKNHGAPTLSNSSTSTPTKKIAAIQSLRFQFFAISLLIILMAILYETSYALNSLGDSKVGNLLIEHLICLTKKGNAPSSNVSISTACPETFRSYQYPAVVILTDCQSILGILIVIHYALALKAVRKLIIKWITFPFIRCRKSK
ncbi:uncharacterized protein [Oscarella lobularis]|uniref:uncharacterized protein n=1 Tax=Oscarella lobularis TaxID=121494 RepID=UPI003313E0B5